MDRRTFLTATTAALTAPLWAADMGVSRFQFCLLEVGDGWDSRKRALVRLGFEIRKRCNIPVETESDSQPLSQVHTSPSPFFILSGGSAFEAPTVEEARLLRLVLQAGGLLLFDDFSPEGDTGFYDSAKALMARVYPELQGPAPIPADHALYQSYYLLKEPRGRLNKADYLEGWKLGTRTSAFFSHNDLLGAMETDALGAWSRTMEIGGGFRRELCFRLGINFAYYTLTLHYKKDRAFPPIIERRRRQ